MKKEHTILFIVNLTIIIGYAIVFLFRRNYEFIAYIGVTSFFLVLIVSSVKKVDYPLEVLIGLTIWSILHLSGGGLRLDGERLYDVMLIELTDSYPILRYDQAVHVFGFFVATLVAFTLLKAPLKKPIRHPIALGIVVVMAGLGMGALNEILEFIVSICVSKTGVGGYLNTSLDLCANLIGALLALLFIHMRYLKKQS